MLPGNALVTLANPRALRKVHAELEVEGHSGACSLVSMTFRACWFLAFPAGKNVEVQPFCVTNEAQKGMEFVQSHMASGWQSEDMNPRLLAQGQSCSLSYTF